MTITFPRALLSSPGIKTNKFGLEPNVIVHTSPLNMVPNFGELAGALLHGVYTFPPMLLAQAREWKAWLISLDGPANTFLGFDPDGRNPAGTASTASGDAPKVKGASQTGTSLVTDGWRTNQTGLLLPGDWFAVGDSGSARQLKMVMEQFDSDGLGEGTLSFKSPLQKSPADNANIIFESPVGMFQLVDEKQARWTANEISVHGFSFAFIERQEV